MHRIMLSAMLTVAALALASAGASGSDFHTPHDAGLALIESVPAEPSERGDETLWIYVEDFEDPFAGDWTVLDMSGTIAQENYWHIDTIRPMEGPGDHSWWCGRYNTCWPTPRGYANDWYQVLSRHFTGMTGTGAEEVEIVFWQRFAMEADYDYGYVDISDDGGDSWTTLATYTNLSGLAGGTPVDWDDPTYGHVVLDISEYAGSDIDVRFRFESDGAFSSADEPEAFSVVDGAWQIDNFTIFLTIGATNWATFYDDFESGENGWTHDAFPGAGQTGTVWWRGQYGIDFDTGWPSAPGEPPVGSYMYAPVDPVSGTMMDGEDTWLMSPPIDVGGAEEIVSEWSAWIDLPAKANDYFDIWVAARDDIGCVVDRADFIDGEPGYWYGGPFWATVRDDWSAFGGNDWMAFAFLAWNAAPPTGQAEHRAGVLLNSFKVGIPVTTGIGNPGPHWNHLSHASPNPFGRVTRIAYRVRDAGSVRINVYNVAGKVVRTLLDSELAAGATGEVVWDGTDFRGARCARGVYFCRIATPGFSESRKMVLLE